MLNYVRYDDSVLPSGFIMCSTPPQMKPSTTSESTTNTANTVGEGTNDTHSSAEATASGSFSSSSSSSSGPSSLQTNSQSQSVKTMSDSYVIPDSSSLLSRKPTTSETATSAASSITSNTAQHETTGAHYYSTAKSSSAVAMESLDFEQQGTNSPQGVPSPQQRHKHSSETSDASTELTIVNPLNTEDAKGSQPQKQSDMLNALDVDDNPSPYASKGNTDFVNALNYPDPSTMDKSELFTNLKTSLAESDEDNPFASLPKPMAHSDLSGAESDVGGMLAAAQPLQLVS